MHHATKALAMHQANEVWNSVARHLFPDASGHYAGRPRVGRWWDYQRIPGRARSHTKPRKWAAFRLHGTLAGHLATYRHPDLPEDITPTQAADLPPGTSVLAQPRRLPAPKVARQAAWWEHTGPLAVAFTGGPDSTQGELVLPVRLPSVEQPVSAHPRYPCRRSRRNVRGQRPPRPRRGRPTYRHPRRPAHRRGHRHPHLVSAVGRCVCGVYPRDAAGSAGARVCQGARRAGAARLDVPDRLVAALPVRRPRAQVPA